MKTMNNDYFIHKFKNNMCFSLPSCTNQAEYFYISDSGNCEIRCEKHRLLAYPDSWRNCLRDELLTSLLINS